MGTVRGAISGFAALTLLAFAPVAASKPGDILVVDSAPPERLIRVKPATGAQTIAAESGLMETPASVTIGRNGTALVADQDAYLGNKGGVIGIDLRDGTQVAVASNALSADAGGPQLFENPLGVAVSANRKLIVTDKGIQIGDQPDGRVILVDPRNGRQRLLTEGINLRNPFGIVLRSNGRILVSDVGQGIGGNGRIISINPRTGAQAIFAQQNLLDLPRGLSVYPNGTIYAADEFDGSVVRIRPGGAQSVVTAGDDLNRPYGLARQTSGNLVVSDWNAGAAGNLIRVNPFTNSQSLLSPGGNLSNNLGATIIPPKCGARPATIYGTPRRDTIKATRFPDVIAALAGNDRIVAFGGNDLVCGGAGKDQLSGGSGRDRLFGQAHRDRLIGGPGRDLLNGGPGRDGCLGGAERDRELSC